MYQAVLEDLKRDKRHAGIDEETLARHAEEAINKYLGRGNNESSIIEQKKEQIDNLVTKIVGLVLQKIRTSGTGPTIDKAFIAKLKTKINAQKKSIFGPVGAATSEGLDRQYQWLREAVEIPILQGQNLQGLPLWLR
jgi:hypothetical protein